MTEETTNETTQSSTHTDETHADGKDHLSPPPPASEEEGEKSVKSGETEPLPKIQAELHQLVDFSTKYPELGPVIARLAVKLGFSSIAERVVRLGLEQEDSPVEYYFVAARLARDEGRYEDVLSIALDCVRSVHEKMKKEGADAVPVADRARLLHLIRLAFATLMFDFKDIRSNPGFTDELNQFFSEVREFYRDDSFFHQLYAQSLWFSDEKASEEEWERALEVGDPEDIWNSRGTWYKEASKNMVAAESAYRRGLEKTADSALLMHNLAQILMDRAEANFESDIAQSAVLLNESEGFLRRAKRVAHRNSMRSHVLGSFDRLRKLKAHIDSFGQTPEVGDVLTGRVISLRRYGVFVVLPSGHTGLLHSSEIDHYWVEDATTRYNENDAIEVKVVNIEERPNGDGSRISLSRKVLIPKPADFDESLASPPNLRSKRGASSGRQGRGDSRGGGRRRSDNRKEGGSAPRSERRDSSATQGSGRRHDGGQRHNNNNNNAGGKRRERQPQQYRDSGTAATIADLLAAKLNIQSKNEE